MARIPKAQKAGLDFLDQIFFNELVVYRGMNSDEHQQLETIVTRVTQMAQYKYSGREAEIIKHLVYFFFELHLANTFDELEKVLPINVPKPDIPKETIDAVHQHTQIFYMAFMLAIVEKSTGFNAKYALEIFETLKNEFNGYGALVRRDLMRRCFALEFEDVSLNTYCWLTVAGVLPVTKNGADRINRDFNAEFITRLTLMADYEMVIHNLHIMFSKITLASVFLCDPKFDLNEATIDRLLDVQKVFNESSCKSSLRSIPLLNIRNLADTAPVQNFFTQWANRKSRLRMHSGTLASWLGFLGAGMVDIQIINEYRFAAEEKFKSGVESFELSDLKIPALFNACDNKNTITEFVKWRLSKYGLQINSDTLYRTHSIMNKTTLRLLHMYCNSMRDYGVASPFLCDDPFYMGLFVQADKMPVKNGVSC